MEETHLEGGPPGQVNVMDIISGYARVMAKARVEETQQKPLLRKPYLMLGQCIHLWSYFFALSGVLGAKYVKNLDEFGTAFLGVRGEPGAVRNFFTLVTEEMAKHSLGKPTTIFDYTMEDSMKRLDFSGDSVDFFQKYGMQHIGSETAAEIARQYAENGSALGAIHPDEFRKMFERTNEAISIDTWERAKAAGLDIPQEPTRLSYEELEVTENDMFMAYCSECCPDLYAVLNQ